MSEETHESHETHESTGFGSIVVLCVLGLIVLLFIGNVLGKGSAQTEANHTQPSADDLQATAHQEPVAHSQAVHNQDDLDKIQKQAYVIDELSAIVEQLQGDVKRKEGMLEEVRAILIERRLVMGEAKQEAVSLPAASQAPVQPKKSDPVPVENAHQ